MPFPIDWNAVTNGGLPKPGGIRSVRVYIVGTTTTDFADNAYAFRDIPGASNVQPSAIVRYGSESNTVIPTGPTGGSISANPNNLSAALVLPQTTTNRLAIRNQGGLATGTLTLSGNVSNGDQVTTGTKTYTFQTVLTNVDGNVLIGGTASDSIDNLISAINLDPAGAGVVYAALTTPNEFVSAAAGAGDTMDATALEGGFAGNTIVTDDPTDGGAVMLWSGSTLAGGSEGDLEFSFDGINVQGVVLYGERIEYSERYESGISIRGALAGVSFIVEGW